MDTFWLAKIPGVVVGACTGVAVVLFFALIEKVFKRSVPSIPGRIGGAIVVVVAVSLAGNYNNRPSPETVQQALEEQTTKLLNESKATDGKTSSDLLQENALKEVDRLTSKSKGDPVQEKKTARDLFFGFFATNIYARPEYCQAKGIDISSFVNEFKKANSEEIIVMRKSLSDDDIEKYRQVMKATIDKTVAFQMKSWADELKVSTDEVCLRIKENPTLIAESLAFKDVLPEVRKTLVN